MMLRRWLPVIAGVVFACAGGSMLVAWLAPPAQRDPFAGEQSLTPIPERAPRARSKPRAAPAAAATTDCVPAPTSGVAATPPTAPAATMLGPCPRGTSP